MWFRFILPLIVIGIEFYFFTGVQTIIKDFQPQRKVTIQIIYWVISGLTILGLSASVFIPMQSWPQFVRSYLATILFVLFASKLIGSLFLLVDDIAV